MHILTIRELYQLPYDTKLIDAYGTHWESFGNRLQCVAISETKQHPWPIKVGDYVNILSFKVFFDRHKFKKL